MMRPRADGDILLHGPSKARRAAFTAASMSAASPSATDAIRISVAGSKTSKYFPDFASTHLPSISIGRGLPSQFFNAAGTRSSVELVVWMFILVSLIFLRLCADVPGQTLAETGPSGFGGVSARKAWRIRVPRANLTRRGATMTRIFLAGIFHETHSFTDDVTGIDRFMIHRGQALLDRIGDG